MGESESEMIGVAEAAEILDVSRMTIHRMIDRGDLKPVERKNPILKRPVRVQLRRADVEALRERPATDG